MPTIKSPIVDGPIRLTNTARVSARVFRDGKPVSGSIHAEYTKVVPSPDVDLNGIAQGLKYSYYEGSWDQLPDFKALEVVAAGVTSTFDIFLREQSDYFGFQYEGFILLPEDGIYSFYTDSDDGSRFYIGSTMVVENDGLHGMNEERGSIALRRDIIPFVSLFLKKGVEIN